MLGKPREEVRRDAGGEVKPFLLLALLVVVAGVVILAVRQARDPWDELDEDDRG